MPFAPRPPRLLQLHRPDDAALAAEAAAGLQAQPARAEPKLFYDTLGSRLFEAITELDEYATTRSEAALMQAQAAAVAQAVLALTGPAPVLVDLGAGNCAKAAGLFGTVQPRRYVAVDIAVDFLAAALQTLQAAHPHIEMVGVGLDFSAQLQLPAGLVDGPALVFYPGSSIGNFTPDEALPLLRQARELAAGGALLIGVDLLKPAPLLQAAYDDELGVTAAFNLNLLRHLNRLLGANFQPRQWRHVALFNEAQSRVEMHLEAREALAVQWPGGERRFAAGERLHTENACKYTLQGFAALLHDAGYTQVQHWVHAPGQFAVFLASAH
ncbi:methyltransferase [beta proteobacterium AAP51]|nr:methyltransferase [beta proteobacterium AAP51]